MPFLGDMLVPWRVIFLSTKKSTNHQPPLQRVPELLWTSSSIARKDATPAAGCFPVCFWWIILGRTKKKNLTKKLVFTECCSVYHNHLGRKNVMEQIVVLDSSKRKQCFFWGGEVLILKKLLWMVAFHMSIKEVSCCLPVQFKFGLFFGGKKSYG